MTDDILVWERLFAILDVQHWADVAYVYRLDRYDKPITPYLFKWYGPSMELINTLQTKYGGGEFRIIVRRGRKMIFSGYVAMAPLPAYAGWISRF